MLKLKLLLLLLLLTFSLLPDEFDAVLLMFLIVFTAFSILLANRLRLFVVGVFATNLLPPLAMDTFVSSSCLAAVWLQLVLRHREFWSPVLAVVVVVVARVSLTIWVRNLSCSMLWLLSFRAPGSGKGDKNKEMKMIGKRLVV